MKPECVPRRNLVVVDSELLHRMYEPVPRRYGQAGAALLHAPNGSEAVNLFQEHDEIDLVLRGVNMPVINGLQVLSGLRATGQLSQPRVIMVSTEGREADVQRALTLDASGYVMRPFTPADLHSMIDAHPYPDGLTATVSG